MVHYFHLLTSLGQYSNLVPMLPTNKGKWEGVTNTDLLSQLAIDSALSANWQDAVKINEKILKLDTQNVEALNRLARALCCLGHMSKANKTYQKALEIDPYNVIAKKNQEKICKLKGELKPEENGFTNGNNHMDIQNLSAIFVFEPGKTKVINLLNLASPSILATLSCGDKVIITAKKHSITIAKEDGTYLGALPDDLSFKLIGLITGGNKYEVYVKYATTKSLTIFIRETERSAKFTNQPSFAEMHTGEKNIAFA
ncbi:MAG: hypothetical protein UV59_C0030G0005 [Candidatus Gottesmanbacteria bacterium GW2011_GWA1_43_11]|uniref:Uncharacterized protein n=1 Tax=Candidatus Gottesmanbacteria bacterium GW2011_GWA1_43_11 TaxID=1618436 RepID=A0A0G1CEB9_9BACT|nr:MAG: hypothetical protein UV59_C0030G0005 [Candidatus Gottesmanbacteria bacterium GW2011_GWA1_43_11]